MQGFLETLGLPYTGSGVAASAIAMNKELSKRLWQAAGLPVPEARLLTPDSDFAAVVEKLGLPLMVKPAHEGSSVGMSLVHEAGELQAAFESAWQYDKLVLAERYIAGGEYTITILGERALPVIRLQTPRAFYDYAAKYTANDTAYLCPCGLPAEQEHALQALALQAFRSLGATGWGRVDLMLDQAGRAWLLEVNTVPGMTDHSLVPMAAKAAGLGFDELCLRILDTAWR
jgi:D-alanine-D-alanine ligase